MAKLQIDFQEGFQNDTVVILMNGQELFHKDNIKTNYAISLAAKAEIEVPTQSASLEVSVPTRKLSARIAIELPTYLAISIVGNAIQYETSDKPFRYL